MNNPTFSILLPTHNRPETLLPAIQSAIMQSREDWELLVVGDGCTDETAEVVNGFNDSRIRWFDLPKGPGFGYGNRNIALREAQGEIVVILAHDNLLFSDHLELLEKPFLNPAVQFAYSRPLWIGDDGLIMPFFFNLNVPSCYKSFMEKRNVLPTNCVAHRRSCLERVGYWPELIHSSGDWDLWKRILNDCGMPGVRVVRSPTCLHFRANWRDRTKWAPPPVPYYQAINDAGGFWPNQLQMKLNDKSLPQSQILCRMQDDPKLFSATIRAGCEVLEDMFAWQAGQNSHFPR